MLLALTLFNAEVHAVEHVLGNSVLENPFNHHVIDYGQVIYGTLIVFVILGILVFLLKKSRINNFGGHEFIKIISSYPLSTKDKLIVIKVAKEYLLVGVSSAGINKLHKLNMNNIEEVTQSNNVRCNNFSNIYAATIGRFKNA